MLLVTINQLFIDLVGNHHKVMADGQVGQTLQRLIGLHHTGGVAGTVDDQHTGPVSDERFQLLQVDLEVIFLPQLVADRDGFEEVRNMDVVEPHGIGDQDLVAGIQKGSHGGIGSLAHTDGHQDLFRRVLHIVVPLQLFGDCLAQLRGAIVGGVKHIAPADAVIGGILDDLRSVKIGPADLHVDDVLPHLLHLIGPLHHHADAGERKHLHTLSSLNHSSFSFPLYPG